MPHFEKENGGGRQKIRNGNEKRGMTQKREAGRGYQEQHAEHKAIHPPKVRNRMLRTRVRDD